VTYNDHPHIFHPVTSAGARLPRNGPERPGTTRNDPKCLHLRTFAAVKGVSTSVLPGGKHPLPPPCDIKATAHGSFHGLPNAAGDIHAVRVATVTSDPAFSGC
jgi:hypothetical protein